MRQMVFTCDRCKAEMAENGERYFVSCRQEIARLHGAQAGGVGKETHLDLCPKCHAGLQKFLSPKTPRKKK